MSFYPFYYEFSFFRFHLSFGMFFVFSYLIFLSYLFDLYTWSIYLIVIIVNTKMLYVRYSRRYSEESGREVRRFLDAFGGLIEGGFLICLDEKRIQKSLHL